MSVELESVKLTKQNNAMASLDLKTVTIIGSGTMGNGISHVFAQCGFNVHMMDINQGALDKAVATIGKNMDRQYQKAH